MDTIPSLCAHAVAHFGERVALIEPHEASGASAVTYSELQRRVQSFAGFLQASELQKGERVLLWSASRIEWMVAYLAVPLVGGVVVPLDVHSTETFLRQLAQTTEAKYLIATPQLLATLANSPVPGVEVRLAADGEILVRGPIVARGYWKNPEATSTTFRDGWCYTGDLGSLDAAGHLYLKGRKSNRIVLANGMNVYPEDWPEKEFPRTHTLKVKRPEVLETVQAIRQQEQEEKER